MSLLRELQRRNVIRVATAYVVSAWLVIQVVDTVFRDFGLSDETYRIIVIVLAIGFIPAVVGAWVFEWTPEGLKRDTHSDLPVDEKINRARRFDRGIIVVLLIAVTYFAVDKFVLTGADAGEGFYGHRSIAVMPFEVYNAEPEQRFFANGVTDEIRYLLGTIRNLRVIAERSSSLFHENAVGIAVIREEYKVGHLLEGSVRKVGGRVRVTARLVETSTETQLWSDVYEREIDDVFRIQEDIARNVLHNLEIELQEPLPQSRNVNPEAYALVQQVSQIFQVRGGGTAARMYPLAKKALELDPDYPEAVKWMINSEWMRGADGLISWEEAETLWKPLIERYALIAPRSGYLEAGDGFEAERAGDYEQAADFYLRSLEKELTDSEQLRWAGRFALLAGKLDTAARIFEHAVAVDPLCHQCRRIQSQVLMFRGGPGDYRRALEIREQYLASASGGQPFYSILLMLTGEPDKVADVWADVRQEDIAQKLSFLAMAEYSMGKIGDAEAKLARLEKLLAQEQDWSAREAWEIRFAIGYVSAWMDDADKAFAHLMPPPENIPYTDKLDVLNPVWHKVVDDPRWLEYREAIGMSQERFDAIEFDPWLPE